jgi:hypothetical protein
MPWSVSWVLLGKSPFNEEPGELPWETRSRDYQLLCILGPMKKADMRRLSALFPELSL